MGRTLQSFKLAILFLVFKCLLMLVRFSAALSCILTLAFCLIPRGIVAKYRRFVVFDVGRTIG